MSSFGTWLERWIDSTRRISPGVKTAVLFAALAIVAVAAAYYDRTPDLAYVKVAFLSGSEDGNYHAVVARIADEVAQQHGRVDNIATAGSVENIARLAAAKSSCNVQFGLVQDGLDWPAGQPLELIGRLGKPESLIVLGRGADSIRTLADLRGKRIGIGPEGSGTAHVARQVLAEVRDLGLVASPHSFDEQLTLVQKGELDLAAMVIDRDAQLVTDAVRSRGLQIVDIAGAEAIAQRLPFARSGRIPAGHYDPVRELPASDKRVIEIDTLVIGNGCARDSVTQGLITALTGVFPDFLRVNREGGNVTGLQLASAARSYYSNGGPDIVGVHAPWVIDIMPTARWLQLIFAFSLLFNAMALWHRFRLWRIDASRVRIEREIPSLFSPHITVGEIAVKDPEDRHYDAAAQARLDSICERLRQLSDRCRRQSLSILVPMGQEMSYRYQESLIGAQSHALRSFRSRLDAKRARTGDFAARK